MMRPPPIRLVVLLEDLELGDTRRYAVQLLQQIDRTWFAPELWVLRGGKDSLPEMRAAAVDVVYLSEGRRVWPRAALRLAVRLWRCKPDVLYTLTDLPNIWGRLISGLMRIPVVSDDRSPMPRRHARMLHRFSARIIADTAARKDLMTRQRGIEPKQVTVISNSVETDHFSPDAGMVTQTEKVLREVAQRGRTWTTTDNGEVPLELPLWPDVGKSARAEKLIERGRFRPDRSLRNVAAATLTVYLPPPGRATGTAAVICPGGGYEGVTIDKEGHDVARWLTTYGVVGLVLKYRLPRPDVTAADTPWPLQDMLGALRLAREYAGEWRIDPQRLGAIGFSAGGHMAAAASIADHDLAFAVLVYPVISMEPNLTHKGSRLRLLGARPAPGMTERYSFERHVTAQTCPTLVVHARDDDVVKQANSMVYAAALRRAGVSHELLYYDNGGHGFGLGVRGGNVAEWPIRCIAWLRAQRLLNVPNSFESLKEPNSQ